MTEETEKEGRKKKAPFHLLQRHQMPFLLAGFLIAHMEDQQTCIFSKKILVRLFFLSVTELRNLLELRQYCLNVQLQLTVKQWISCTLGLPEILEFLIAMYMCRICLRSKSIFFSLLLFGKLSCKWSNNIFSA